MFKGKVDGDPDSWAVITLGSGTAAATIAVDGERWSLMPAPTRAGEPPLFALSDEATLENTATPFRCGIDGTNEAEYKKFGIDPSVDGKDLRRPISPYSIQLNSPRLVFDVAIDCDYEIYVSKFASNLPNATSYILTLLGTVSLIYERDCEFTLRYPYVNLWTVNTDPYTQNTTSAQLPEFRTYWENNHPEVTRSLAHLISGRSLGGGIAYIGSVCGSFGYAVSAIDAVYSYPTNTATWDAVVVAHELGHNLGSYHTHSCSWASEGYVPPGATLDTCQASEGGCNTATNRVPPNKGTIMSYCHLISGVPSGLRLDFHPVCISKIRTVSASSSCWSSPSVAPPRNPSAVAIPTGLRLQWTAGGSPSVLRYDVYRSRTQLDLTPVKIGNTSTLLFDTSGLGTYYYKMRTMRAADSSQFSAEVKAVSCNFTNAGNLVVGSLPSALTTGDWNEDGIQDLAVVVNNAGNVSVLLGNGTGGVGNGTFAPAVSLATATSPICIAAADLNGDGIVDLVVGSEVDTTLAVHLGNGTAGVGNGTFAAASTINSAVPALGVAIADLDEDGIQDLVAAGGANSVAILRGLGLAGVGNGTFAQATLMPAGNLPRSILVGDFNSDGVSDLAVTSDNLRIFLGNGIAGKGDGTFQPSVGYPVGATPNHLASGDFNADGITDLAVANSASGSVSVLLGNGTGGAGNGTFGTANTVASGSGPNGVSVGDWNGDGLADLALANNNASKVASILLGKGDGTFEGAQTFAAQTSPSALVLGDFNEDGGYDLAVANRASQSVSVLLAGCAAALPTTLALIGPDGGEQWVSGEERPITWSRGRGITAVDVQVSRDSGINWQTIARSVTDTTFTWTVTEPASAHVRMRVMDDARPQYRDGSAADFQVVAQSALAVDEPGVSKLALLGAYPNPMHRDLTVALSLPGQDAASLELLDLAGRRVAIREVGSLGAGRHRVKLTSDRPVRAGLYLLRLRQGDHTRSLKVAVLE
ncbi:MAG: FG-GAP-like repeat-containing protein [Candidatus Eisenbacteria bacterium]